MLKILDEKILRTDDEIEELYKDCKYLYIIDSYDKLVEHNGYLYCVSTSNDSFDQLIDEREKLRSKGKLCVLGGSYNNGGALGVQYEFKDQNADKRIGIAKGEFRVLEDIDRYNDEIEDIFGGV